MKFDYIKCHGSGNEFVMVDAVKENLVSIDLAAFARFVCDRENSVGADGVLLIVKSGDMYGMRMFNPDGSEAEMCGNGIGYIIHRVNLAFDLRNSMTGNIECDDAHLFVE